jgi:hypothetical protein
MAENKKSFLLYADQVGLFEKLPDETAGKLIKLIFDYVNDKDPDVTDVLLQVAFEPIRLQLKRDLKKWEVKREHRVDAGRLGGLRSGEARRSKPKQTEANEAVTVNDTVTVNVNDTVSEREDPPRDYWAKEEMKKLPLSDCFKYAALDESWLSKNKANALELESFNEILEQRGETHKTVLDYKSHFAALKRKHPHLFKQEVKVKTMKEIEAELERMKDIKIGDL